MKQTFKITHFVSRSDNAIRIRVTIAMISIIADEKALQNSVRQSNLARNQ
jgi:hypothetical protein